MRSVTDTQPGSLLGENVQHRAAGWREMYVFTWHLRARMSVKDLYTSARASGDRKNRRVDKHNIYFLRVCIYIYICMVTMT